MRRVSTADEESSKILELIQLAYRGILRREATAEDLEHYLGRISAGDIELADLLRDLMECEEYGRMRLAPYYNWRADPNLTRFQSEYIVQFSKSLEEDRPLPRDAFESAWTERFERELGHSAVDEDHRAYGEDHKRRFWDLVNGIQLMRGTREEWRVLDFGLSVLTAMYVKLFPGIQLFVSDRPLDAAHRAFFRRECEKAGVERLFENDLNDTGFLTGQVLAEMGTYDCIILTEVLEHLTTHPVHVFRQVSRLLRPDGHLYVTTPNFFSVHHLREVDRRINPQHPFPLEGNEDAHYHHREYGMSELLKAMEDSGLCVTGFYFSDCWEDDELRSEIAHRPDERSNLVVSAVPQVP